jgi:hypothetical protein
MAGLEFYCDLSHGRGTSIIAMVRLDARLFSVLQWDSLCAGLGL